MREEEEGVSGTAGGLRRVLAAVSVAVTAAGVAAVVGTGASASATTVFVSAAADAYTNSGAPGTNLGTSASLGSRGTPAGASFLRFVLPAVPAGMRLESAHLLVRTTTDPTAVTVDPHAVSLASDTWTESTVTWSTRPAVTGPVLGVLAQAPALDTPYEVALDAAVLQGLAGAPVTLALTSSGTDGLYVRSSDYGSVGARPQLRLTWTGDATTTPAVTTQPVARTLAVPPLADTYANAGAPSTNYGSSTSLASRGTPGAVAYLRFAVPAAPSGLRLEAARLLVRTTADAPATSTDTHVVGIAADTWDEATLTWNTRPADGGRTLGALSGASALNTGYAVALDRTVLSTLLGTQATLTLTGTGSDSVYLWSSNHGNAAARPQLELTFAGSSATASPSPTTATTSPSPTPTSATPTTTTPTPTPTPTPTVSPADVTVSAVDALLPYPSAPTVTWWGGSTTSFAGGLQVLPDDARLRYRGATGFAYGTGADAAVWAPASKYPHTWGAQGIWSLEFVTDAPAVELHYRQRTDSAYRLAVDGRVVSEVVRPLPAGSPDTPGVIKFDFGASKQRRLTVDLQSARFTGLTLPGGASLVRSGPAGVRWAVLGDSISSGSAMNAGYGQGTWVMRAARLLGWNDAFNQSSGGTGYVVPGQSVTFGERLAADVIEARPDKVVLFGGYNDSRQPQASIRSAAADVLARLRTGLPEAQVIVVGCWSPRGVPAKSWVETNATLAAVAREAGVPFVSILDGRLYDGSGALVADTGSWITGSGKVGAPSGTGNADRFIGSDGVHPTDSGHAYLGRRMAEALALLSPGEDVPGSLTLTWDAVGGARTYEVHRAGVAGFTPGPSTRLAEVKALRLTDVPPSAGRHHYAVVPRSRDAVAGPVLRSAPVAFPGGASPIPDDALAPAAVLDLDASRPSSEAVSLTWAPVSDDGGRVIYEVHRSTTSGFTPSGGTLVGLTGSPSFEDVRAPAGALYRVVAVDPANNAGPPSAVAAS